MQLTDRLTLQIVKELLTVEVSQDVILTVIKVLEVTRVELEQQDKINQEIINGIDVAAFMKP
jgi:hypothetical protein